VGEVGIAVAPPATKRSDVRWPGRGRRLAFAGLVRPQVTVGRAKILFGLPRAAVASVARSCQLGNAFVDPALFEACFHFDRHVRVFLGAFGLIKWQAGPVTVSAAVRMSRGVVWSCSSGSQAVCD